MRNLWIGLVGMACGLVLWWPVEKPGCWAATEPPTIAPGGGESPVTGGRPDDFTPELGTGNRGSGMEGRAILDPSLMRSQPSGPGIIVGQVLAIQGDTYIVQDRDGNEVVLKSTPETQVQSVIGMGERVEANVDSSGMLMQIKPAPGNR